MKILQNWRIIVVLFLIAWCVVMIHPFSKQAAEITTVEDPSSTVMREGDLVFSINGEQINSFEEFAEKSEDIAGDEDVQISIERETFPYRYMKVKHNYITNDDDNPLSFYAKPSTFSRILFNANLQESNKFTIKTSDQDNTIDVLTKRFKTARLTDFILEKQGSNVVLYSSSFIELIPLIESKGDFEAKIGDAVFFTEQDIESYCVSGVNCLIHTYPVLNQTKESKEVLWKYGFETRITKDAAAKFNDLTEDLNIVTCEFDRCELDAPITYIIDGKEIGYEKIYADDKGGNFSRAFIGGEVNTKADAVQSLRFMQAVLAGKTDAEITDMQRVGPLMGERTITIFLAVIAGLIALNAVLLTILFKDLKLTLVSIALGIAEIIIIFGTIAGLNFTITFAAMIAITAVPVLTLVYQNYSVLWIKKEGLILRKISMLNSKLNIWMWIAAGLSLVLLMFKSNLGAPLLIYFILTIIVTKGLFFRTIRAKRE